MRPIYIFLLFFVLVVLQLVDIVLNGRVDQRIE